MTGDPAVSRRHGARPRIVWVTPFAPAFGKGGGEIRQAHLLRSVAAWADIDLVALGRVDDEIAALCRSVAQGPSLTDPARRWARRVSDLMWLARPVHPIEVRRAAAGRQWLAGALAASGAVESADLFMAEYAMLAPLRALGGRSIAPGSAPWAITVHNLESTMSAESARLTPRATARWMYERNAVVARRFEASLRRAFDAVIAVSADDAKTLGTSHIVENAADGDAPPAPLLASTNVIFTGALHAAPNVHGIRWFVDEVWPRVIDSVPEAHLHIVGSRPPDAVTDLARRAHVDVHADVISMAPHLHSARVAVVPLFIGSGTRLKALEAMAAGVPVVGTTIGLGGLGVRAGTDALVADDPWAFAVAIVSLLRDDDLAARMARAGGAFVSERNLTWHASGTRLREVLEPLIATV